MRIVIGIFLLLTLSACGWLDGASRVADKEFSAQAMLDKYEWFKRTAADIDKSDQDVELFRSRAKRVDDKYVSYGKDHSKWPLGIQSQYLHDKQEAEDDLTAIVSNRNGVVRDYNAQASKFNWASFQGRHDMPKIHYDEY